MSETYYEAINWNEIEDIIDKSTWEKLTEQFWLDTIHGIRSCQKLFFYF